jgi:hypothetical protein
MTMTTPGNSSASYEVGYGKPPRHTQFRKGQSGNPGGRPKRESLERMKELVLFEAYRGIAVKNNSGYTEPAFVIQMIVRKQMELAMSGNLQAQRAVLAMVRDIEKDNEHKAILDEIDAKIDAEYGLYDDGLDGDEPAPQELDAEELDPPDLNEPELEAWDSNDTDSDEPDLEEPALEEPDREERDAEEADAAPALVPEDGAASAPPHAGQPPSPSENPPMMSPRRRRKTRPSLALPSDEQPIAHPSGAEASRRRGRSGTKDARRVAGRGPRRRGAAAPGTPGSNSSISTHLEPGAKAPRSRR